jgi:elongation factor P
MEVVEAEEAVAGDRSSAGTKPVTMQTGLVVQVPLFIKKGEKLLIDTTSGKYVSRA